MDGKGRCLDNIPIERFWRTVKYEEVYLRTYERVKEVRESIGKYIEWYNRKRRHSGIGYQRPYDVMMGIAQAMQWPFQKVINLAHEMGVNTLIPCAKLMSYLNLELSNEKNKRRQISPQKLLRNVLEFGGQLKP